MGIVVVKYVRLSRSLLCEKQNIKLLNNYKVVFLR